MADTWLTFKNEAKTLMSDVTASDNLYALACACYVKAALSREVDHDVQMRSSYLGEFRDLKRRLLGFQSTLVAGTTLDTEVNKLLPVDSVREGINTYVTAQIANADREVRTLNVLVDKLIKEAIVDLQSHIPCYRVGTETVYDSGDVTAVGSLSRGPLPPGAELSHGFWIEEMPELTEGDTYATGDLVQSNDRTYRVYIGGTMGDVEDGLVEVDGSLETLGGLQFTFYYGEGCLRSELVPMRWQDRFSLNYIPDNCQNKTAPARILIDREAFSFWLWPQLDSDHTISLFWNGIKVDFSDGDLVPFDESAQQAVKEYVLSRFYLQSEENKSQAETHAAAYASLRSRMYADCSARLHVMR